MGSIMTHRIWMARAIIGITLLTACSKSTSEAGSGAIAPAPAAPVPSAMPAGDVGALLSSKFGLTPSQASGAVGSILSYAQGKLPAADFQKVAATIPTASTDMKAAKDAGAVTGPIADPAGLNAALGKLGISPEIASQVIPVVTEYVGKVGGPTVGKLMAGLF
jgi:hypothetical protein